MQPRTTVDTSSPDRPSRLYSMRPTLADERRRGGACLVGGGGVAGDRGGHDRALGEQEQLLGQVVVVARGRRQVAQDPPEALLVRAGLLGDRGGGGTQFAEAVDPRAAAVVGVGEP